MTAAVHKGVGEALLQDILANSDDDVPRLIYADWLEEGGAAARAEFIRVQCRMIAPGLSDQERRSLRRRERELRGRSCDDGCSWHAPVPHLYRLLRPIWTWRYHRGFIGEIACACSEWLALGPAIVCRQPVQEVRLIDSKVIGPAERGPSFCPYFWVRRDVPTVLWDALESDDPEDSGRVVKHYLTYGRAIEAMSRACLGWAKRLSLYSSGGAS